MACSAGCESVFCRTVFFCLFSRYSNRSEEHRLSAGFTASVVDRSAGKFGRFIGRAAVVAALLIALLVYPDFAASAHAARKMDKNIYGFSTMPYWSVGTYDAELSRACQQRRFGQRRIYRYFISFVGQRGRAIIGIATRGWNLHDPGGLAQAFKTYHFFNDGYSDCAVYVATQPIN